MPDYVFESLPGRLCDAGYSRREADHMAQQLTEHFDDLVDDLRAAGYGDAEAGLIALRELGSVDALVDVAGECRRREHWAYRYPAFGRAVLPIAVAAIPEFNQRISPTATAASVLRWGMIVCTSAMITASMLLAMQIAISAG